MRQNSPHEKKKGLGTSSSHRPTIISKREGKRRVGRITSLESDCLPAVEEIRALLSSSKGGPVVVERKKEKKTCRSFVEKGGARRSPTIDDRQRGGTGRRDHSARKKKKKKKNVRATDGKSGVSTQGEGE